MRSSITDRLVKPQKLYSHKITLDLKTKKVRSLRASAPKNGYEILFFIS